MTRFALIYRNAFRGLFFKTIWEIFVRMEELALSVGLVLKPELPV